MCCMSLGEAAGTAAALSIKNNVKVRDVDVGELQRTLVKNGVNIGQRFRSIPSLAELSDDKQHKYVGGGVYKND